MSEHVSQKKTRRGMMILMGVVALIILAFILLIDWQQVFQILGRTNYGFLAAASAALVVGLLFFALRWRVLMENKPRISTTFHAANVGFAGNILIPFRGGEALRIFVMGRSGEVSYTTATSSFVVERLFEQLMRLLMLAAAVLIGVGLKITPATVLGGVGFVLLLAGGLIWLIKRRDVVLRVGPGWLARLPKVSEESARHWLADFFANIANISRPSQISLVMFYSLLAWFFFWLFFYLTLRSLGDAFPPEVWLPVSLGAMALSPPSAPTQPGLFHASIVVPLTAVGYNGDALTAYAVILHLLEMFWMIGLAALGLLRIGLSPGQLVARANE
jgi:uncharacterized protein (TIRG00374 family)